MYMKILISENQLDKIVKKIKDGERFIKCDACNKLFTQTIHKGKKSLPICPWCGKHNTQFNENQDVEERSRSFAFSRKKRLFTKAELMANPARYRKHEKDLKEIGTYKFSEMPSRKNNDPNDYQELMDENPHLKTVGDFIYLYNIIEDSNTPIVMIYVLDSIKKVKAAVAEFEMRYGDQFFVTLPYVKKEYRNMGIAAEIYKSVLMFGDLVSGKAQSQQAVGLWKKMFKTFPNKMTFIDNKGVEHEIISKDDKLIVADTGEDVHGNEIGGYLKMKRTI